MCAHKPFSFPIYTLRLQPNPGILTQSHPKPSFLAAPPPTTTTMATINAGVSLSAPPRVLAKAPETAKVQAIKTPWMRRSNQQFGRGLVLPLRPVKAAPEGLSEKVAESVKNAEETCAENPESGECVAAWDEVEEVSAAASHARDRKKEFDPLETYCKDNPETEECRTYDN